MKTVLFAAIMMISLSLCFSASLVVPKSPAYNEPFGVFVDSEDAFMVWRLVNSDKDVVELEGDALPANTVKQGKNMATRMRKVDGGSTVIFRGVPDASEGSLLTFYINTKDGQSDPESIRITPFSQSYRTLRCRVEVNGKAREKTEKMHVLFKDDPVDSTIKIAVDYSDTDSDTKVEAIGFSAFDSDGDLIDLEPLKKDGYTITSEKTAMKIPLKEQNNVVKTNSGSETLTMQTATLGILNRLRFEPAGIAFTIYFSDKTRSELITFDLGNKRLDSESVNKEQKRLGE